jgi:hypothetical protein
LITSVAPAARAVSVNRRICCEGRRPYSYPPWIITTTTS